MVRKLVMGSLIAALLVVGGLTVGCGSDPFVGTWGVDDPMPGTERLEMVITKDGETYTVDPTAGIEDARKVEAQKDGDELVGTVAIEEMTIELRFVPGEEADTLDLKLTGRQEGKPSVSFDFTLQRKQ
jgi:hypothetical protein